MVWPIIRRGPPYGMSMLGRDHEQVNAQGSIQFPKPRPRTTRVPRALHKEQALSCHCLPLPAGGECLPKANLRGIAVNQLDKPLQQQRHFTRGRVISAAFLFSQALSYKTATGTRSTDGLAGLSAINATPMTTSTADPTRNPTF